MWTEYRYSSEMSCIGQSLAAHSMIIAPAKAIPWRRVNGDSPNGAALGAMTRAAYQAMAIAARRMIQTSAWGWYRQMSVSAAKAIGRLPETESGEHDHVHRHGQNQPENE